MVRQTGSNVSIGWGSLSQVLRGVAESVEPFGFHLVDRRMSPPMSQAGRYRFGERPDLLDHLNDCQVDEFQCVHKLACWYRIMGVALLFRRQKTAGQTRGDGRKFPY